MSPRYQRGSLRREKRSGKSDVWVRRYRLNGTMKQETYKAADYKTKTAMWQYLEPAVRVLITSPRSRCTWYRLWAT